MKGGNHGKSPESRQCPNLDSSAGTGLGFIVHYRFDTLLSRTAVSLPTDWQDPAGATRYLAGYRLCLYRPRHWLECI